MNQRALLIAVVIVLIAGAGGYMLLVKPPREDVVAVESQVQSQRDALTAAQAALQTAQAAKAQYRAAYAEIVKLGKAVPADDELQSLLVQLSASARSAGVRFDSLERNGEGGTGAVATGAGETTQAALPPGATVGSSGFPIVPLKLTFRGRYFELADFLQSVDGYVKSGRVLRVRGRLLTIDGFTLEADEDEPLRSRSRTLTATVTATAYLLSPVEGATAGATAAGPSGAGANVSATATPSPGSTG